MVVQAGTQVCRSPNSKPDVASRRPLAEPRSERVLSSYDRSWDSYKERKCPQRPPHLREVQPNCPRLSA